MNGQNQVQFPAGISVDKIMSLVDTINSLDRNINISISVRDLKMRELNSYGLTIVNGVVTQKREPVREVNPQAKGEIVSQPEKNVETQLEPPRTTTPSAAQTVSEDVQNAVLNHLSGKAT